MGSCSLRLHAPQQVSSSVHLSGLVLDAHRYIGKEKITSENRAEVHCHSATAGLAAALLKHNAWGFYPLFLGYVLEEENFDQSYLVNSVKKYGS